MPKLKRNTINAIKNNKKLIISGVEFTHVDKIFSQTKTISKESLARYYEKISDLLLPHIVQRPLSIVRAPLGSKNKVFFQKHFYPFFPKAIYPLSIGPDKKDLYIMIKNKRGLLSLIQFDVLEIHPWGSKARHPDKPDRILFDLDPAENVPWKIITQAALYLKQDLALLNLKSYVKTSGGKGLHIVIPIKPQMNWDQVKLFCHTFVLKQEMKRPELFTATLSKSKRNNKIFIDYLRNARGATTVAAYSTRARVNCPISVPLAWRELTKTKSASDFTLFNIEDRLKKLKSDPWVDFFQCRQSISLTTLKKLKDN